MTRPSRPGSGRFDLIPPGAERRLAQLFERDAAAFGPRDWEAGRPLSAFVNDAHEALNLLKARDTGDDHAARVCWAMLAYMQVEGLVHARRLPAEFADMPAPDPILVPAVAEVPALPPAPPPPPPPLPQGSK